MLIYRQPTKDQVNVICGDWAGNALNLSDAKSNRLVTIAHDFLGNELRVLLTTMRLIKIEQAQFFFAIDDEGLILADVQIALNKLAGPGLVKDIFGRVVRTQEVLKVEVVDERVVDCLSKGVGAYAGDLILKPSKFRLLNSTTPLYVEIKR